MKQALHTDLNQHLKMTPQLQQSIKLLQLSSLELQQEIQHQLDINPMLDVAANEDIEPAHEVNRDDEQTDFQWSHIYTIQNTASTFNQSDYPYETLHCTTMNLKDHLIWQVNLSSMSEIDQIIAMTLIDAVDDSGFLTLPIQEIYHNLTRSSASFSFEACEAVRHRLQRFDPVGCCSVDLAESLLIQLEQLPESTPHRLIAKKIIHDDIALLGEHDYGTLMKRHHLDEHTLSNVVQLIQHLHPRPGNTIQQPPSEYIIPDLMLKKIHQQWCVTLNPAILPNLRINDYYATLAKNARDLSGSDKADRLYLRNNLQDARCFLKNIKNRQETLLKVANYIVQFQTAFIESGEQAMKPLILNDVAQALHLHASTISRVTTQKFIHTPRGLLELRYFFSHPVSVKNSNQSSSKSIRATIKQLIAHENTQKPLSDIKISALLLQQGIQVARRTVTKYREWMGIAPSHARKSTPFVS